MAVYRNPQPTLQRGSKEGLANPTRTPRPTAYIPAETYARWRAWYLRWLTVHRAAELRRKAIDTARAGV